MSGRGKGRPAIGTQVPVALRPDQLAWIEQAMTDHGVKRAEVIRDLIDAGIQAASSGGVTVG